MIFRGILEKPKHETLAYRRRCQREERKSRVMEGKKLQCGECGFLSNTVGKAEEHAKNYCHTNFILSEEQFIDQHCCSCPTHCNSPMALELHRKRSDHSEYEDTEAKLRREEARRVEEILAKFIKAEEEIRILMEKERRANTRLAIKQQEMRSCLDSIKQSLKFVEQLQRAFDTLVMIVKNVVEKPAEEKYRRIRISAIEKRLGYVEAGFKFLELCKFEKVERGEFLVLPYYEVEDELLEAANVELTQALGEISKEQGVTGQEDMLKRGKN
ncbi:PUB domain-containing protein [Heracleum sosnowskyi]|uniref:PUB domain-containing protein n=1 Tax=Heracleum sosnowskyi TaxID=360622 RepID=A0AAD8M419_9APIA|nr:PUB domain-containing protein [Heracleum sosnowskyi]